MNPSLHLPSSKWGRALLPYRDNPALGSAPWPHETCPQGHQSPVGRGMLSQGVSHRTPSFL